MLTRSALSAMACAGAVWASGGKSPTPEPTAPNSAEVRISNEVAPAGGTVQIKYSLTNPQPIMSGGTGAGSFRLRGVSLGSLGGDAAGAAVEHDGMVYVTALSPLGDLGIAEYPFLTMTMEVPASLAAGTSIPLTISPTTMLSTSAGPLSIEVKPGTLVIGGSFSIDGVTPGGGTYPAGTTIRIGGQGFPPNAQLITPQMKFSSYKVISSTEIDFTLKERTTLDGQPVQITNGPFTQTYYSYLRGVPLRDPSKSYLKNTDPIFQQQTHALANAGPFSSQSSNQYVAFALQNPNPGPAVATLNLTHSDGSVSSATIVFPSGGRIMDDLASLLNVNEVQDGDRFSMVATSPIQILGLNVDENAGIVAPFLPVF